MRQTDGRFFADSNILLYLLDSSDHKKQIAAKILSSNPVISTQVIAENVNIAIKKFKTLSFDQISLHKNTLIKYAELVLIKESTINLAFDLKFLLNYQWFDCLIISAAIENNCDILFTEDLQHLHKIENKLTVINPFT